MEAQLKAFFYDYKYYLFPEDCETLGELKGRTHVRVKRLKEERCMAPDFVYESMAEEELEIESPERIFEVSVNLYTAEEYDEILREQVKRVCRGCARFGNDFEDLEGHHREISLEGVCYERENEEDSWDFATCIDVFWYRISEIINELAECIDRGDQKKLNKLLNRELGHFFPEVNFYGGVEDGKYCLSITSNPYMPSVLQTIYSLLAETAMKEKGPMSEAGWLVRPYRGVGSYPYSGKIKADKPLWNIVGAGYRMAVVIFEKHPERLTDRQQTNRMKDVDNFLCAMVGENVVRAIVAGYQFSSDIEDLVTPTEAVSKIQEAYAEAFGQIGEEAYPMPLPYCTNEEAAEFALPLREGITEGVTNCSSLSFLGKDDLDTPEVGWWRQILSFAYLYIPRSFVDDGLGEALMWYLANGDLIPEPIRSPYDTRIAAGTLGYADCGGEGFVLDFAVVCEQKFYRTIRTIAPVLMSVGAKLVVVNQDGVLKYACGYEFTLID